MWGGGRGKDRWAAADQRPILRRDECRYVSAAHEGMMQLPIYGVLLLPPFKYEDTSGIENVIVGRSRYSARPARQGKDTQGPMVVGSSSS